MNTFLEMYQLEELPGIIAKGIQEDYEHLAQKKNSSKPCDQFNMRIRFQLFGLKTTIETFSIFGRNKKLHHNHDRRQRNLRTKVVKVDTSSCQLDRRKSRNFRQQISLETFYFNSFAQEAPAGKAKRKRKSADVIQL